MGSFNLPFMGRQGDYRPNRFLDQDQLPKANPLNNDISNYERMMRGHEMNPTLAKPRANEGDYRRMPGAQQKSGPMQKAKSDSETDDDDNKTKSSNT